MARFHKFDPDKLSCVHCEVKQVENYVFFGNRCNGNPAITRIGRKFLALARKRIGGVMRYDGSEKCHPYGEPVTLGTMRKKDLADLAAILISGAYKQKAARRHMKEKPTVAALLRGAVKDLMAYGVIADTLEEAGCEDQALLEALRTT